MDKKTIKLMYWTAVIVCAGFGILEWFMGSRTNAVLWFAALAVICVLYALYSRKKNFSKDEFLVSLLDERTKESMRNGTQVKLDTDQPILRDGETLLWMDQARQDYYKAEQGTMYLTSDRLIFFASGFSFRHPLRKITITPTRNGFKAEINGKAMSFVTASTPEFLAVYERIKGS